MDVIKKFASYREYKKELDNELQKTAEGFVRIGFLLKQARDTNILEESGYKNYIEFAKAEYNIDKTTVSRFIRINDRFSEGGNTDKLQEQYKGFGYAKLALMLQLPDAINEELSPNFTKSEVQAIKEEVEEEGKVSDIERMLEMVPEEIQNVDDMLGKAIMALGKEEPELYYSIHHAACWDHRIDIEKLKDDMTPNEEKIYSIRIPGIGRVMLSLKADGNNTMTNIRSGEKTEYTWEDIAAAWKIIIDIDKEPKEDWEEQYSEEWPIKEKPEVAPVQQKIEVPKKKEQKKVQKAKPEPKEEPKPEEQIPEQDTILNHPEYLPNDEIENVTEQSEVVEPTIPSIEKQKNEKLKFWMDDFHDNVNMAESQAAVGNYGISKIWIKKCIESLENMERISEEEN